MFRWIEAKRLLLKSGVYASTCERLNSNIYTIGWNVPFSLLCKRFSDSNPELFFRICQKFHSLFSELNDSKTKHF